VSLPSRCTPLYSCGGCYYRYLALRGHWKTRNRVAVKILDSARRRSFSGIRDSTTIRPTASDRSPRNNECRARLFTRDPAHRGAPHVLAPWREGEGRGIRGWSRDRPRGRMLISLTLVMPYAFKNEEGWTAPVLCGVDKNEKRFRRITPWPFIGADNPTRRQSYYHYR